MGSVKVIYGSSTGETENAARQIAAMFGVEPINVADAKTDDFKADLLILGSSTWGLGELQDDWLGGIALLEQSDLAGCKVAVFGLGDQEGFSDTFCDAMAILAEKAVANGATLVGQTPTDGYRHTGSLADQGGMFCGLALDDTNEPDRTADRIIDWAELLKC